MRVWQGRPHPLGATWDGQGVNVAVFSEVATQVSLCLFDATGVEGEQVAPDGLRVRVEQKLGGIAAHPVRR